MTKRNPLMVILLSIVTFGIYGIYWEVKTKGEMNALGADIPTALLIIVPIANLWWMWKYSQGVEKVTNGKLNAVLVFLGFWFIGIIMAAIAQDSFNNVSAAPAAPAGPAPVQGAPVISAMPLNAAPAANEVAAPAVPTPAAPTTLQQPPAAASNDPGAGSAPQNPIQ